MKTESYYIAIRRNEDEEWWDYSTKANSVSSSSEIAAWNENQAIPTYWAANPVVGFVKITVTLGEPEYIDHWDRTLSKRINPRWIKKTR